jgi:hypothetical protein
MISTEENHIVVQTEPTYIFTSLHDYGQVSMLKLLSIADHMIAELQLLSPASESCQESYC